MTETPVSDDPIGAMDTLIDRATAAHDTDLEGEAHARSWCLVCWQERTGATEQETPHDR